MDAVLELTRTWEADADRLELYGDEGRAQLVRLLAAQVREAMREVADEELTLSEAAIESGYSADHLRHLVADGTIPNAGRKGAPRIRRRDLPLKPGAGESGLPDAESAARDILGSLGGEAA